VSTEQGHDVREVEEREYHQHYQSMRSNRVASQNVEQALAIAQFDPEVYEVVKVFSGSSKPPR
jgi:hypothetical protein